MQFLGNLQNKQYGLFSPDDAMIHNYLLLMTNIYNFTFLYFKKICSLCIFVDKKFQELVSLKLKENVDM